MKINVSMFGDSNNKQILDPELFNAKDFALQSITLWMRFCDIKKVQLNQVKFTGINYITELTWKAGIEKIPSVVNNLRAFALLNIIKGLMDIFGIYTVEIELEDNEREEQLNYWNLLINKPADKIVSVPLIAEQDPTNTPV